MYTDPFGLEPRSTVGGDDPGFDDPAAAIAELEKQLKDPKLTQKERQKIRDRIKELRRKPSKRQQHHKILICPPAPTGPMPFPETIPELIPGSVPEFIL